MIVDPFEPHPNNFMFVHKHKASMTKTIGLSDDAYDRLATVKDEDESFSDVVRRLTGGPMLRELAGTMDEDTAEHYREAVSGARARQDRDRRARVADLADGEAAQERDDGDR